MTTKPLTERIQELIGLLQYLSEGVPINNLRIVATRHVQTLSDCRTIIASLTKPYGEAEQSRTDSRWIPCSYKLPNNEDFYDVEIGMIFLVVTVEDLTSGQQWQEAGYLDTARRWRLIAEPPQTSTFRYPTAEEMGVRVVSWLPKSTPYTPETSDD